jgi:MFS transporter, MHS family, proline/betaine transporter
MDHSSPKSKLRVVIGATTIGNTLEWLDFALIGHLSMLFGQLFFNPDTLKIALIDPLSLIALAALVRPLGGIIFGFLGDRKGRKPILVLTVLLMSISTSLMTILPTYASVGGMATLLLILVCIFQGFCIGGEFPGSMVYLLESCPTHAKGYVGNFAYFGVLLGMLLSGLELMLVKSLLTTEQFDLWGWRLCTLLGTVLGMVGFFLRWRVHETPVFQKEQRAGEILKDPLFVAVKKFRKEIFKGIAIFTSDSVGFNLIIVFINFYFTQALGLTPSLSLALHLFTLSVFLAVLPLAGKLSLRVGTLHLAKWSLRYTAILAIPLFLLMDVKNLWTLFAAQGILSILQAAYLSTLPSLVCTLFPADVRYTGVALVVNFSAAIFGSTASFIIIGLIKWSGALYMPGFYLAVAALVSLYGLSLFKEEHVYHD